jgi:predicted metal-binding protein
MIPLHILEQNFEAQIELFAKVAIFVCVHCSDVATRSGKK